MVQYSTLWYSAIHYGTVQYTMVQCSTLWYSAINYGTVQYTMVQCSTLWYSAPEMKSCNQSYIESIQTTTRESRMDTVTLLLSSREISIFPMVVNSECQKYTESTWNMCALYGLYLSSRLLTLFLFS